MPSARQPHHLRASQGRRRQLGCHGPCHPGRRQDGADPQRRSGGPEPDPGCRADHRDGRRRRRRHGHRGRRVVPRHRTGSGRGNGAAGRRHRSVARSRQHRRPRLGRGHHAATGAGPRRGRQLVGRRHDLASRSPRRCSTRPRATPIRPAWLGRPTTPISTAGPVRPTCGRSTPPRRRTASSPRPTWTVSTGWTRRTSTCRSYPTRSCRASARSRTRTSCTTTRAPGRCGSTGRRTG